jgi:hypothetical protein
VNLVLSIALAVAVVVNSWIVADNPRIVGIHSVRTAVLAKHKQRSNNAQGPRELQFHGGLEQAVMTEWVSVLRIKELKIVKCIE